MRILILVLLFAAFPTFAIEPLASGVLIEECSSTEEARQQACHYWIHGYIGGAFASRTARYVDPKRPETFSERAKRTRSSRRRTVYGRNLEAGYCLPDDLTIKAVIGELNAHVAELEQVPELANQLMLGLLRKQYPCR